MSAVNDRRSTSQRRKARKVDEPVERRCERRLGDRRDSPRVTMRLWVKDPREGGVPKVVEGDVGVGGAFFRSLFAPLGRELKVGFRIPGQGGEVLTDGEVLRTTRCGDEVGVHVAFKDLDVRTELALARYVEAAGQPRS